jgi:hypothetical protein
VPFLSDQRYWRAARAPPTPLFSPKCSSQNFVIAIFRYS